MSIFTNNLASAQEEAAGYTSAVLGLLGDRDPIDVLRNSPQIIQQMIAGIDEAVLSTPESPGKWSVRQVIAHLTDSELVVGWRVRIILATDAPDIIGVDQDIWAERMRYDDIAAQVSLATFTALRGWNLLIYYNATPQQLQRFGVHSERGEESVAHIIRLYAGHDILHQRQIARILSAVS